MRSRATGRTNGPVLTIPNGIDVAPFESSGGRIPRWGSTSVAGQSRSSATSVPTSRRTFVRSAGCSAHRSTCWYAEFLDRSAFLALLGESRIVVCLPLEREGFYLPALEAMACGLPRGDPGLHRQPRLLPS